MTEITGIILAGGRSSRFGTDKALALYRGKPLISHVAGCLESLFPDRLLITNDPENLAFLDWPMTGDLFLNHGPLAGIHAALKNINTEKGFIIGCDMPLLKPGFISALCNLPGDWQAALPWLPSGPEPLHAVYRKEIHEFLELQLTRGNYKVTEVLQALDLRTIDLDELRALGGDLTVFYNINQRKDLDKLERKDQELSPDPSSLIHNS